MLSQSSTLDVLILECVMHMQVPFERITVKVPLHNGREM